MGHRSLRSDGSFSNTSAGLATELSITSEQSITLWEDHSEPRWAVLIVDFYAEGPDGGEERGRTYILLLPSLILPEACPGSILQETLKLKDTMRQ